MQGYLSLVLHAHLPFVRHPEHPNFLEESWLFEAITESYIPLLQLLDCWERERLDVGFTISLTPTLCTMLMDPLLQERYARRLDALIELAEKEIHRTRSEADFQQLALFYHCRWMAARDFYEDAKRDLVSAFRNLQQRGRLEIMTSSATHALLPLLAQHPPSVRAQIHVARDHYRSCFGCDPRGIWLPECAYSEELEPVLREAGFRWFILDSHGIINARPKPRYAIFAPILTPGGLAAFARDPDSARQVWSREAGYPGDARYRDFYRDIGFDQDFDYVKPYFPAPDQRGFTGAKYYRITSGSVHKQTYNRASALQAAVEHAQHFLQERTTQIQKLADLLERSLILVCPYDAKLFGHWWYEGPEFLDSLVRKLSGDSRILKLITPEDYLRDYPNLQIASPAASSWGEHGYWGAWLNEQTEWIYPHLRLAQERMTELVAWCPDLEAVGERALKQAARELLLAQASDWPFLLRTGTNASYARKRVNEHLLRFTQLYEQILAKGVNEDWLREVEAQDNIFPDVNPDYWAEHSGLPKFLQSAK